MIEKIYETEKGDIHYWLSNIIDNNKKTLVFLPGLTADHRLFDKQIEYFEPIANVFVWDAPGHAASYPFEMSFNLEDKARWLKEILDTEKISNPIIVGQSMGGYVGQVFQQLYKNTATGFVVIDSAPLQRKYMSKIELWLINNIEPMYRMYPWKTLVIEGARGCSETEYGINLMKDMIMTYDDNHDRYIKLVSHGYKILAEAVEKNLPYEIDCPTVLVCGEKDKAGFTKKYNIKWHLDTNYPIHWISKAGHNSNTDAPDTINSIIFNMLSSDETSI